MDNLSVIIVAGGSGLRMGSSVPKQFLVLRGLPVLMHSIRAFEGAAQIIVVLHDEQVEYWRELCSEYCFGVPHEVALGGSERFYSVRRGLQLVRDDLEFVAVHDGVRPWVSSEVIYDALRVAGECGSAVPVVAVTDSIREVDHTGVGSRMLNRRDLRAVQTPQIFRRDVIMRCYERSFSEFFTDDASVVEASGYEVRLSVGDVENIKITTPKDLLNIEPSSATPEITTTTPLTAVL